MPTCEKCQNTWTWKETFRKSFTLYPDITCPYCGETQYQTYKSRMQAYIPTILILLPPFLLNLFFDLPGLLVLSLFPILFIIFLLIHPFYVKVSSEHPFM